MSYFDDMVGALLETLSLTGLAADTVVVVTADHGDMLGEHGLWFKKHFFDHCARVPLVVHAPAYLTAGRRRDNVSLVDLLPTLCEFAGLDVAAHAPEPLDGESLVPLCGPSAVERDTPVYAEITSEGVPEPMFMVRHHQHKLISGGGVPSQLFDLDQDPHERHSIATQDDAQEVLQRLEALVAARWDVSALAADIRLSQRRRRLVDAAHHHGPAPEWDYPDSDATRRWLLRGDGLYNDWAWQGIE